jgi:DNA polymerase V
MKLKKISSAKGLEFYSPVGEVKTAQPYIEGGIAAGFPSPADDFAEIRISLDESLVKNKAATFYARVSGESMIGAGLDDGDLVVIDRSIEPKDNKIAVCFIDGEFTVKRLKVEAGSLYLMPENERYKPIEITPENNLLIWGIVTYVIKSV